VKDIVYLVVSRAGVQSMRKSLPDLKRGEIALKVHVTAADKSFAPPTIEQHIDIQDPYQGVDLEDVHFNGYTITQEEADVIRQRRLAKAAEILTANGYAVSLQDKPKGSRG
jgi:hypothetical protein